MSASNMEGILSTATVSRILNSTARYADDCQREACGRMVSELTEEEQELAARTSYAYWVASELHPDCPSEEVRNRMAMREARRHLVGEGNNYDKGLTALRASCVYRKERKVDIMRTLFNSSYSYANEEEAKVAEQYRLYLKEDLGKQLMVVRGMDRESRAIVLKFPRQSSETTDEAFVTAQLYIAERAIAATEVLSEGREEKVVAIADFGEYSSSNAPPWSAIRSVVHLLQPNYPERLDHLIILDAPFFMRALFNLVHPFLRAATKEKVVMIADDESKRKKIGSLIAPEHAMPFMLPEGQLTSNIDLDHFLTSVPFHALYDAEIATMLSGRIESI